jgi:hypothetical protein
MRRALCVTVESTSYIYTDGDESGVIVGLINYSRFPAQRRDIIERAMNLAEALMTKLCQRSFSLMTPERTKRYIRQVDGVAS